MQKIGAENLEIGLGVQPGLGPVATTVVATVVATVSDQFKSV